jgi:glycosyltransferase involved in cell wall biosynthesis
MPLETENGMKILIICDIFPPAFGPRMGYLCKYMKRAAWEPVVLTEYIEDATFSFLTGDVDVSRVRFYRAKGRVSRKLEWVWVQLLDFLFHYKDKRMEREATLLLNKGGYGGILCSTYRTFPLLAAVKAAAKLHLPVVADLRDIIEQYPGNEFISHPSHTFAWLDKQIVASFRKRLLRDRNRALIAADCITTVSPWHVEVLKKYNPDTRLIYNGYDPELFYPEQIHASQFRVTFTGRLISLATRDPELLFEAVRELDERKQITPETFRVQWFTDIPSQHIIKTEVKKYRIETYMDYYNYVPAFEIPEILNQSSVLLQLANKADEKGPKGFMTTKLFEAFAVEKPILCVRSDESYLAELLSASQAGLAAREVGEVCTFVLRYYAQWKEKGYTAIEPRREITESFSREKQAAQFMQIFARHEKASSHHCS